MTGRNRPGHQLFFGFAGELETIETLREHGLTVPHSKRFLESTRLAFYMPTQRIHRFEKALDRIGRELGLLSRPVALLSGETKTRSAEFSVDQRSLVSPQFSAALQEAGLNSRQR